MTDTPSRQGVTVATLLRDLADSRALVVNLAAGRAGLERRIVIPQPQKTGLALSGFDAYLHGGRVLVFGESEIRYVESLPPAERFVSLKRVFAHDLPCVLVTGGFTPPNELVSRRRRSGGAAPRDPCGHPRGDDPTVRDTRRLPVGTGGGPRRADGHPRPGRPRGGGERHRQE